jgi:hypothetical protein
MVERESTLSPLLQCTKNDLPTTKFPLLTRQQFPADFLLEATAEELANLKLQFARSSCGDRKTHPMAFTEHGAIE